MLPPPPEEPPPPKLPIPPVVPVPPPGLDVCEGLSAAAVIPSNIFTTSARVIGAEGINVPSSYPFITPAPTNAVTEVFAHSEIESLSEKFNNPIEFIL